MISNPFESIPTPLLALIAAALFGAAVVVSRPALREMSPLAGATISVPTTAILLWALAPFLLSFSGATIESAGLFAAIGLFFPAAVTLLNFESNRRMGPTVASTVSSTAPLFAILLALLILHERLNVFEAVGIVATVGGVMMLSLSGKAGTRNWPLWALIIPAAGALFRGSAQAVIKIGLEVWRSPFAAALIGYSVSAVAILCIAFVYGHKRPLVYCGAMLPRFSLVGALNGFGLLFGYDALQRGQVATIAPILATFPLFTYFLGAIFLHDVHVTPKSLAGVLLTVAGVIIMTRH